MKSFQAVDEKDNSPRSRLRVSRTSIVALLCPTSMHAVPFDFELTRQVNSGITELDIVLPRSQLDLQPHPAYG